MDGLSIRFWVKHLPYAIKKGRPSFLNTDNNCLNLQGYKDEAFRKALESVFSRT